MSDNSRVRVSIVGVVIVALFSTLLARLWFLQSGPEDSLKVQAVVQSTRVLQTPMPRGEIKDRNGEVLVRDRLSWAVTVGYASLYDALLAPFVFLGLGALLRERDHVAGWSRR